MSARPRRAPSAMRVSSGTPLPTVQKKTPGRAPRGRPRWRRVLLGLAALGLLGGLMLGPFLLGAYWQRHGYLMGWPEKIRME